MVLEQCNRTVTLANQIKCTRLNPPITEVITITVAATTFPSKLGIFHNGRICNGSLHPPLTFSVILDIWCTNAFRLKKKKKNSRTLRTHFPFFKDSIHCKKRALVCLFQFSHNISNSIRRSFCVCSFSLEFYINYKVSIKIQGLSSTYCIFQGISRCMGKL